MNKLDLLLALARMIIAIGSIAGLTLSTMLIKGVIEDIKNGQYADAIVMFWVAGTLFLIMVTLIVLVI